MYVNHGNQTVRLELTATAEELAVASAEHVNAELNSAERIARTWTGLGYARKG